MRSLFVGLLLMGLTAMMGVQAQTIYFVKPVPVGLADGSDWNNASADLQAMINKAAANDQVWVAGGTYLPNRNIVDPELITPDNRHNAFLLKKDVRIFGGFAGTEVKLADRDLGIKANTSLLSGDIGAAGDPVDNAYHVVVSEEEVGTAELNGFTISYGYNDVEGGAVHVGAHMIYNVHGGGIYNCASSPRLTNLIICANRAFNLGGGIYNIAGSAPVVTNVVVSGNKARIGGGIFTEASVNAMVLTNVTIAGNLRAGLTVVTSLIDIRNSVIAENEAQAVQVQGSTSTVTWTNSLIEEQSINVHGNIQGNLSPGFVGSITPDLTTEGDFHISEMSPLVNAGSTKYYDASESPDLSAITTDLEGSPRNRHLKMDIGAYESPFATPLFPRENGIVFVSVSGAGLGNGNNWDNAAPAESLQRAINWEEVQQVWVAKGTYKPVVRADGMDGTASDRNNAFVLKKGVQVYGGFKGTEAKPADRDLTNAANASILSGEIGDPESAEDNCYHVVIATGESDGSDTDGAVLDGFTIRDGYADGTLSLQVAEKTIYPYYGGGIYTDGGAPVLRNLTIQNNFASKDGGGYYMQSGAPVCSQMVVSGNQSVETAGLCVISSSPVFTNALIMGNFSTSGIGGIKNDQSTTVFTNSTIVANQGPLGGLLNQQSVCYFRNSLVYDNPGGIDNSHQGRVASYYSLVQDMDGSGVGNQPPSDPQFIAPRTAGQAPFTEADFRLKESSPGINAGLDEFYSEDSLPDLHLLTKDLGQDRRIQGGRVDLGAYESTYSPRIIPSADGIVYVSEEGRGDNTGNSWENAASDLQKAIDAKGKLQVWVAGGVYYPRYIAGDGNSERDKAFVLKNDVRVLGGFAGTETTPDERGLSIRANVSILSGNLGDKHSTSDNAYHVVISAGEMGAAQLDGFAIQDGNADGVGACLLNGRQIYRNTGGGLVISGGSPVISATAIQGNFARMGGGIYNIEGKGVIVSSLISGNTASEQGGGVYNASSPASDLINVTIAGNYAGLNGGALYNIADYSIIWNSIIYGNSSGVVAPVTQQEHVAYSLIQGWTEADGGNIPATDPGFSDPLTPSAKPSTSGDYRLSQGSPAINAGNQDYYEAGQSPDLYLLTTDLYGYTRKGKGAVDLGAIESQFGPDVTAGTGGIAYVTQQGSGNFTGSSWENATDDLQGAIDGEGVSAVWVGEGTYTPQRSANDLSRITPDAPVNSFVLKKDVQVYGSFAGTETSLIERTATVRQAHPSILSGEMGDSSTIADNAHHVVLSVGDVGTAELNGFIIEKGYGGEGTAISVNTENIIDNRGAGIYNFKSSPKLANLMIRYCLALQGGGICNEAASPKLSNISVYQDTAFISGGGIANFNGSSPEIVNAYLQYNLAAEGGGMYTEYGAPLLTNVLIAGNSTYNNGAGLYNLNADPVFTNVTIAYNFGGIGSGGVGGSMANFGVCNFEVRNSVFYGNKGYGGAENGGIFSEDGGGMVQYSLIQGMEADPLNHNLDGQTDPLFILPDVLHRADPSIPLDYRLQAGSKAINTGSNAYFQLNATPDLSAITEDLANKDRIQKEVIDMGAFESPFDQALPVTLLDYSVVRLGKAIKISWKTAMETGNKEFIVSRSKDGKSFLEIGRLPGHNTASSQQPGYALMDQDPLPGINYYRLTQIDQLGALTDFGIKSIVFKGGVEEAEIRLFPNPARAYINVQVAAKGQLRIFDEAGRLVRRLEVTAGLNKVDIRSLGKGVYFVQLSGTDHQSTVNQPLKFIKE